MKTFETPTIDIEKLDIADVIATSLGCDADCGEDCAEYDPCDNFVCPVD